MTQENASNDKAYHDMLMELIRLREQDYDKFLDKLYEALTGDFKDTIDQDAPAFKKKSALEIMINHFSARDEFEKCFELKKMLDEIVA